MEQALEQHAAASRPARPASGWAPPGTAGWRSGWRPWAGRLGACVLGAVLVLAAVTKALDPQALAERMAADGLTLGLSPTLAALLALALEGGLGIALMLGLRRPGVLLPATGLVALFLYLNGRAWWLAAHGVVAAECGCFGNLVQRSPAAAFWQDLLLLLPPLLLAWVGRTPAGQAPPRWRALVATTAALGFALLAWRAPELPLDDLATRLRPGVELAGLCAAGEAPICLPDVVPELAAGRWQVVLVDLDQAPERWAEALNRYADAGTQPPLLALTQSPSARVRAFTLEWGPSYPLREVPGPLMRPLHRRLPRSFVSEDGRVLTTSADLPVLPAAAGAAQPAPQGDLPR